MNLYPDDDETPEFLSLAAARTRPFAHAVRILEIAPTGRSQFGNLVTALRAERAQFSVVIHGQQLERTEAIAERLQQAFGESAEAVNVLRGVTDAQSKFQAQALASDLTEVERRVLAPYFKPPRVRGKAQWKQERRS